MQKRHFLRLVIPCLSLTFALSGPAAAQEEMAAGVTLDIEANAITDALPDDADQLVLFRMILPPGAVFPLSPEQESTALAKIERGELTTEVDAPMQVARARAEPGALEAIPEGNAFTLGPYDAALYPAGLTGEVRNGGDDDVSLLIFEAVSSSGGGEDMTSLQEGITVELLAAGPVPDLPDGPVLLWIGIFSLAPEASFPGQAEPGTEIAVGEAGTFTMKSTAGPGIVVLRQLGAAVENGEEPVTEQIENGGILTFSAGDAVYFPEGNAVDISNAGTEPAIAIFGGIGPAPDEED